MPQGINEVSDLILHSFRRCPFAMRVRMVLAEKKIPYTLREEDLSAPSPALLKVQPEGKVPVLIHHEHAISESSIITQYLEERFPAFTPRYLPEDPLQRAQVRLLTLACDTVLKPDLDLFKYEFDQKTEGEKADIIARLRLTLTQWEVLLEKSDFLLGAEMTLADIHLFPFYRQLLRARPTLASELFVFPRLERWLGRITGRPSFEQIMKKTNLAV